MNIEEQDIIKLSDDINYLVVKIVVIDNIKYYYLISIDQNKITKFLYEKENELIEVTDKLIIQKIAFNIAKSM